MNGFIKGTLIVAALAGIGAGGHFGYKAINNKNKEINNLKTEISQVKEDNESLKTQLAEKDNQLAEKEAKLEEVTKSYLTLKDVEIPRIQNELATKTSLLETANGQISTLNTQKVSLLNAVTEIDNKINSSTDAVEIENLELRKTAVLNQIDDLNTQIDKLTTDKQSLQTEVDNLKIEKANLEKEIEQLQTQKTNLEKEIANLTAEKKILEEQIKDYEATTGINIYRDYENVFIQHNNYGSANIPFLSTNDFQDFITNNKYKLVNEFGVYPVKSIDSYFINNVFDSEETTINLYQRRFCGFNFDNNSSFFEYNKTIDKTLNYTNKLIKLNNSTIELSDLDIYSNYIGYFTLEDETLILNLFTMTGKYISDSGNYLDLDNKIFKFDNTYTLNLTLSYPYFGDKIQINSVGIGARDIDILTWGESISYNGETYSKVEELNDTPTLLTGIYKNSEGNIFNFEDMTITNSATTDNKFQISSISPQYKRVALGTNSGFVFEYIYTEDYLYDQNTSSIFYKVENTEQEIPTYSLTNGTYKANDGDVYILNSDNTFTLTRNGGDPTTGTYTINNNILTLNVSEMQYHLLIASDDKFYENYYDYTLQKFILEV